MGLVSALDGYFHISERGSDARTEVKGGILIFLAMSYIIVVNRAMMSDAGVDPGQAFTATILMSVFGTLLMAFYARYPVAMAPGMGINAMFCYTAVLSLGFTWQEALVGVIISGAVFFLISVSGIRQAVLSRIPSGVKRGMSAGIGCFIAFIGLQNSGLIADNPSTLVSLGDMADPTVLLSLFCIVVTVYMVARRSSMGILLGMVVTAVVGMVFGIIPLPEQILSMPEAPPIGVFLDGIGENLISVEFLMVVISLAMMEFFDGSGTLLTLGGRAGLLEDGSFDRSMNVDASIASISGVVGCTPTTAYAESAVGIEAGARTGLAAVVVAVLFAIALFAAPLFSVIDYSCTVGAMLIVAASMVSDLRDVDWSDLPTSLTVITTILMMILSYSITTGMAFGIVLYCISMMGAGRSREVSPVLYGLAVLMVAYLIAFAISF